MFRSPIPKWIQDCFALVKASAGRKRFGEPDAPTAAALQAITDLDRLEALSDRLLDVASWQELLAP